MPTKQKRNMLRILTILTLKSCSILTILIKSLIKIFVAPFYLILN